MVQNQDIKMNNDDALMVMAAGCAERTLELLREGWVQNRLRTEYDEAFCVHGALYCALEEMFGKDEIQRQTHTDGMRMKAEGRSAAVESIVTAFLGQEAEVQFGFVPAGLFTGIAGFNDAEGRTQEEVLAVVEAANIRLWSVVMGDETWTPTVAGRWTEEEPAEQRAFA